MRRQLQDAQTWAAYDPAAHPGGPAHEICVRPAAGRRVIAKSAESLEQASPRQPAAGRNERRFVRLAFRRRRGEPPQTLGSQIRADGVGQLATSVKQPDERIEVPWKP